MDTTTNQVKTLLTNFEKPECLINFTNEEDKILQEYIAKNDLSEIPSIIGYKAFMSDFKSMFNNQYEVGKTYFEEGYIYPYQKGFHFCEKVKYCEKHYRHTCATRYGLVQGWGCKRYKDTIACKVIKVIKEISHEERQKLIDCELSKNPLEILKFILTNIDINKYMGYPNTDEIILKQLVPKVDLSSIPSIIGYKAFDKDFNELSKKRQYEIGKVYIEPGDTLPWLFGYHVCETIEDCVKCYDITPDTRYAKIQCWGCSKTEHGIACKVIKIIEEVKI